MNKPIADLTLQDLILTLKGDRTYRDLEEASGGIVKSQRWNQITNGIRVSEFPEPRTIEAMAQALNVSVDVVVFAFARAVGLDVQRHRSAFADLLPLMVDKWSSSQRDALLAVIRAMDSAGRPGGAAAEQEGDEEASDDDEQGAGTHPRGRGARRRKPLPRLDTPPI